MPRRPVHVRWFVIATVFGPLLFGGIMILPAFFAMRTRASENVTRIQVLDAQQKLARRTSTAPTIPPISA